MKIRRRALSSLSLVLTLAAACSDDGGGDTAGAGGMGGGGAGGSAGGDAATSFEVTIENVTPARDYRVAGVFNTPVGESMPGPLFPEKSFELRVGALPGDRLSFTTMFGQSNDLFYAPDGAGIALYDEAGKPVSGDVTDQVLLWDAGSEANEEPGAGPNQAPRQSGPNTGAKDPDNTVRLVQDDYTYPAVEEVIQVTVTPEPGNEFTIRITNMSEVGTLMPEGGEPAAVPLSPGLFVVHTMADPLFTVGQAYPGNGLEAQAEDGNPMMLHEGVMPRAGLTSPAAPGVAVVHGAAAPLFRSGEADRGKGLEMLAEDGNPTTLAESLEAEVGGESGLSSVLVYNTPVDASMPGPLLPGAKFSFTVTARPGERLSFASMLGQSNDLFFAPSEEGIALFDANGEPVSGDVSDQVTIWDAGTEANQWPGVGPDQAPRQAGPQMGADDPTDRVRAVDDGYLYPAANQMLKVTITPAL
ncbi:spondin domain-containing protein [Sorangium sp. So ce1151]|uniref:spondin domain-containing protein n=1 Tax=Sorangium sp. So ce1151 TaxID=3133332 RepID=UPI003F62EB3D